MLLVAGGLWWLLRGQAVPMPTPNDELLVNHPVGIPVGEGPSTPEAFGASLLREVFPDDELAALGMERLSTRPPEIGSFDYGTDDQFVEFELNSDENMHVRVIASVGRPEVLAARYATGVARNASGLGVVVLANEQLGDAGMMNVVADAGGPVKYRVLGLCGSLMVTVRVVDPIERAMILEWTRRAVGRACRMSPMTDSLVAAPFGQWFTGGKQAR